MDNLDARISVLRPLAAAAALLAPLSLACSCSQGSAAQGAGDELAFDRERAWADLEHIVAFGPRPSGTRACKRLRDWLVTELEAAGLEPVRETFTDATPIGELEFENIYVDVPAADAATDAPIVVLASHFDTKRVEGTEFVGANDGGSSTAVLLELARRLAVRTPDPIVWRVLFLDGEEAVRPQWAGIDNTYGSRHHVQQLGKTETIGRVKALVLLDMVGDSDLRFVDDVYSDTRLKQIVYGAARRSGHGDAIGGRRQRILDDHLPFIQAGIPSLDLIDLDFGPGNSFWHTAEDTLERCSAASLETTGRIVLASLDGLVEFAGR